MNDPFHRHQPNASSPLTVKLPKLNGAQPAIAVPKQQPPTVPRYRRRNQHRATPTTVMASILQDAMRDLLGDGRTSIVAIQPSEKGDPTLLFLRSGDSTRLMLGVPSKIVRSPRLRGEFVARDRAAENEYELMRVAEAENMNRIECHENECSSDLPGF